MAKSTEANIARLKDYSVILSPVITEKSALVGNIGTSQCLVFRVDPRADKLQIREAVERTFKVKVSTVRTINVLGKPKRTTRSLGRRAKTKKAYVTLRDGEKIDVVEGL